MNPRLMRECIFPNYRFIRSLAKTDDFGQDFARRIKFLEIEGRVERTNVILPNEHCGSNFFKGSISCSFSDPVDGAFDLSSTGSNGSNEVCHGHTYQRAHQMYAYGQTHG